MTPPKKKTVPPRKRAPAKRPPPAKPAAKSRRKPPPPPPDDPPKDPLPVYGRNRTAAEATIEALRTAGRLENVDSARIATLQALADAVDLDPSNASLWREYRAAEAVLREVNDESDNELAALLKELQAEMGDPAKH